jgi:phospholipid/cholesterol/gamma-HCH transport system substrate-binding protein
VRRDTVNYTLVGAVVLAALVLLLVGLVLITGKSGATTGYVVHYRNVTGLRYGAPIFYQGYRVGQVGGITPERTADGTRYKVDLDVRRDWPIPKDSPARLQSTGLLADVSVGISEGASKETLAPGGQISELTRNQITPLIQTLTTRVDSITGTIDEKTPVILEQTHVLLDRLNVASASLNDVLKPENRAEISKTLTEVSKLSTELHKTRETLDSALGEIASIAKENRPDLRSSVQDLASVLEALSARMDVITHHLESSSRNLDEFSREIRAHPNRLIIAPKADKVEEGPQ